MSTTVFTVPDYTNKVLAQPPTANSIADMLHKNGSYTYDNTTDSLEAISDKITAIPTPGDATAAELAKVPKSDGSTSWNATALGAINAEVDTALNTIVPASPTAGSLNDMLSKATGGNTFDKATDSLETLSDKLGGYSGDGGAAADDSVKAELDLIKTKTDTITSAAVSTASATTAGTIVQDGATGTPNVVNVLTDFSAATFGSWTQLDSSAASDGWICIVTAGVSSGAGSDSYCLEIGTGGAGAEVTKLRFSFEVTYTSAAGSIPPIVLPVAIPIKVASGTRIAARASSTIASQKTIYVGLSRIIGLE